MNAKNRIGPAAALLAAALGLIGTARGQDWPKPYSPPCVERENVFEFTEKPAVKLVARDRYEITFAVKGFCDATVGIVDAGGKVVRHLASGVLGKNAPEPFQKGSLSQKIYWNGKDDLDVYPKELEKLKVRVMLGLKPTWDKRLGGTSPKNMPGYVWGIAAGPDGAYVFSKGGGTHGRLVLRKFDHDGDYVMSMIPPAANMPWEKLEGMAYVEYEPGAKSLLGDPLGLSAKGYFVWREIDGLTTADCQPALVGSRVFFANAGTRHGGFDRGESILKYIYTDGSCDRQGFQGRIFCSRKSYPTPHFFPRLAASPDGRTMYMTRFNPINGQPDPVVIFWPTDGSEPAKTFAGEVGKVGTDNRHLSNPLGIDCDGQGRVYVSDNSNNRVQIFSPDRNHLKTIRCDRPQLVRVDPRKGAIYVTHAVRIRGRTVGRLTKFKSFDDPTEEWHKDYDEAVLPAALAVDAWAPKTRLWMAGTKTALGTGGAAGGGPSVTIWEDDGKGLVKIDDFDEEARKEAGEDYMGRFDGCGTTTYTVGCPTSETFYYGGRGTGDKWVFDPSSGRLIARVVMHGYVDDIAFDKRGYMHCHLNPGFTTEGVFRLDPAQASAERSGSGPPRLRLKEVPYDYGEEKLPHGWRPGSGWEGILPVRDQPGAKFFQDGIGVNMRGDIVVESNIYYVPKMEEEGARFAFAGMTEGGTRSPSLSKFDNSALRGYNGHAGMARMIKERQARGEQVYSIKRRPGIPLMGSTLWTFDRSGELRSECAVIAGKLVNGCAIDEDDKLYFTTAHPRAEGKNHFLYGRGGTVGVPDDESNRHFFVGTYMKTRSRNVRFILPNAVIPMHPLPSRPPDLVQMERPDGIAGFPVWVEGAEWMYTGASPIVHTHCSCPTMRATLDWYKRSFVSEAYRHSYAVLDTNGNLVMHLGTYGNFDSMSGPASRIPVGGDNIAMFQPRFIGVTDNYLVYPDSGETLTVLRTAYHSECSVSILAGKE